MSEFLPSGREKPKFLDFWGKFFAETFRITDMDVEDFLSQLSASKRDEFNAIDDDERKKRILAFEKLPPKDRLTLVKMIQSHFNGHTEGDGYRGAAGELEIRQAIKDWEHFVELTGLSSAELKRMISN